MFTWDTINDDEGTVSYTESGCDFGWEINVTGGVNQVDQETADVLLTFLLDKSQILVFHLEVHRNSPVKIILKLIPKVRHWQKDQRFSFNFSERVCPHVFFGTGLCCSSFLQYVFKKWEKSEELTLTWWWYIFLVRLFLYLLLWFLQLWLKQ